MLAVDEWMTGDELLAALDAFRNNMRSSATRTRDFAEADA